MFLWVVEVPCLEFLWLLIQTIISSANSESLTSFLIHIHSFSFWCLIALGRISRTILNRYVKSRQPCLVPYFSGITGDFSSFSLMLAVSLLYIALLCLGMFFVFLFSPRHLSWRNVVFCPKIFHHLMIWSCAFYILVYLYGGLHWQIFICWSIPASLGWSQLEYGERWFWFVLGLNLPVLI